MIELQLTLRHTSHPQRTGSAVLLPGGDAHCWLQTLIDASVSPEEVCLLPLCGDSSSFQPIAALCPVPAQLVKNFDRSVPRYAVIADRLFVPVEAAFEPPVADSEWNDLLPSDDSLFVWHPGCGLIRFEKQHQMTPADLFVSPTSRSTNWSVAEPGVAEPSRLQSLQADILPTIEQVLSSGQDDIGSEGDRRSELPPSENEPSFGGLSRLMSVPFRPLAALAHWVEKNMSTSEHGTELYSKMAQWLDGLAQVTPRILQEREREIHRLLDKLKQDPDEGLKFALPMAGSPGRGIATPGSRLSRRNVDFRLGSGSAGPVDDWQLNYELQQQLMAQYRAAAEREVRLGRFRRAAYIHAELLGNFNAAATVLEQGQHYHEAAALYRDRLDSPANAARCLERGGLLHDAIEIYLELKQMMKVGELYLRLDQKEEAYSAFRLAVEERLQNDDRLAAAEILHTSLEDTQAALTVLEEGWPHGPQAKKCLEQYFELLGEVGEFDRAVDKVTSLRKNSHSLPKRTDLIDVLADLAGKCSDAGVRDHAADSTRLLASAQIEDSQMLSRQVLQALIRLAPEDRLLKRDCQRFTLERRKSPKPNSAKRRESAGVTCRAEFSRAIQVPGGFFWIGAESVGEHLYLVGHDDQRTLLLARAPWSDGANSFSSVIWSGRGCLDRDCPTMLGHDAMARTEIRIARYKSAALPPRCLPEQHDYPKPVIAETPGWLGDNVIGFATAGMHSWSINDQLELTQHSRDGVAVAQMQLDYPGDLFAAYPDGLVAALPMHARHDSVSLGLGNCLYRITSTQRPPQILELPDPVTAIAGSRFHTRERLLVIHGTGACLLFPTASDLAEVVLEEASPDLRGTILRDGRVVLWSPTADGNAELRVYTTTGQKAVYLGSTQTAFGPEPAPLQLLPTDQNTECAVIPSQTGTPIRIWHFPAAAR